MARCWDCPSAAKRTVLSFGVEPPAPPSGTHDELIHLGDLLWCKHPVAGGHVGVNLVTLVAPAMTDATVGLAASQAKARSSRLWPCSLAHAVRAATWSKA